MNQNKQHAIKRPLSKKIISTVMSVCTAFPKPRQDLDLNEWQRIEYRSTKSSDRDIEKYQMGRGL